MLLELAGHDVAVRVTGAPASATTPASRPRDVVLVHGIGVSGRYFAPLERELAGPGGGRVVVPDLPGFGDSPRAEHPLSIGDHADVVAALVEHLGLVQPVIVGHSMGAQVVAEAAVRRPDLVGTAVLVGPVADPRARSALGQGARLARDLPREPAAVTLLQTREYARCGLAWYLETLPHMLEYPMEDRVAQIAAPLLLVRGANDPVAPEAYVRDLGRLAGDARLLTVPAAGHVAWWRRPWQLADTLLRSPAAWDAVRAR